MRKLLSLTVAIGIFISTFGVTAGRAQAAGLITYRGGVYVWGKGIAFVFDASGFRNRDVRDATIFVHSNFHDLGCTVNKEEAKIVCVLRGGLTEHAGETGVIYLAGQVFYVTIPGMTLLEEEYSEEVAACEEWEVLGAWVTFEYYNGEYYSEEFIEGESQEEVESMASDIAAEDSSITYYEVSEFGCWELLEEIPEEIPQ